jgi:hypothetical protein
MGDTWSDLVNVFNDSILLYGAVGLVAVVLIWAPCPLKR